MAASIGARASVPAQCISKQPLELTVQAPKLLISPALHLLECLGINPKQE
jgi:hypothetical protein